MKAVLLVLAFIGVLTASAQKVRTDASEPSWKVQWGKKTLLRAGGEDETANVITIRRSQLSKKASFVLTYAPEAGGSKGWNRTITVYGANDSELRSAKGNKLTLSNVQLSRLARGQKELKIYTMAIPSDPAQAAVVRVRRVHLVTVRVV